MLSSQASARSSIVGNLATAQSAFLNNFENVVNRRVDIRKDVKRYQDTLSYASSNAGINLTGYHPPGHPGAFAPKCLPSPRAFSQQKMPGGWANK